MIVHSVISGYYDWVEAPPGTEITETDVSALRAKQMSDDAWHLRVEKMPPPGQDFHGTQIPEAAICDRMASLEKFGRSQSREATVVELLTHAYRHHLDARRHLVTIEVHDSGPDAAMFDADLERLGVTGADAQAARERYAEPSDMSAYLNVVFKTQSSKKVTP